MANPRSIARSLGRLLVALAVTAAGIVAAYWLFVRVPGGDPTVLAGVVLVLLATPGLLRVAGNVAGSLVPGYDVAEVAVEGPIVRSPPGSALARGAVADADGVVEAVERADADRGAEALVLRLNTPGGEVVPSDDIREAARAFDGPTVAYATDTCASGGYWIASGCDELWARDASIVGSIGVVGSQVNAAELADRVGIEYERLAAGKYKDAGTPLKEMTDDEREYLQGLIDGFYEDFVDRVTEGRDVDESLVRETEARVYLGEEATEMGLVDELGTRDDVEAALADRLGKREVSVREFEPQRALRVRIRRGAREVAYAFGAGVAGVLTDDDFEVRV